MGFRKPSWLNGRASTERRFLGSCTNHRRRDLYKNPEIVFPSKRVHLTSSASGNPSVFTAVSLVVHRSTFAVGTSSEYTSPGPRPLFSENASSCPFLCQRTDPIMPFGSFGSGICFLV